MATKHVLGPDVDLDAEDVREPHGQRLCCTRPAMRLDSPDAPASTSLQGPGGRR